MLAKETSKMTITLRRMWDTVVLGLSIGPRIDSP